MKLFAAASVLALAGCAVLSNVTPIGDGVYMTVVRSNDVNARVADEQGRALSQAQAFCAGRHAAVDIVKLVAASPPPGQPPSAEIDFRCQGSVSP